MERKKLKVAFICHLSNADLRAHLQLEDLTLKNLVRRLLGFKPLDYHDYSVWTTLMLAHAGTLKDVEMHAIVLHPGIKGKDEVTEFEWQGVHYHCFRQYTNTLMDKIRERLGLKMSDVMTRFPYHRKMAKQILAKLQPDLVNLQAAECPFISLIGLDVDVQKVPFVLSLQTALSDPDFLKNYPMSPAHYADAQRVEEALFRRTHYFGTNADWYRQIVSWFNPQAQFVRYTFFTPQSKVKASGQKEFDFVYFAANINKAGEDAVDAFCLAYQQNPSLTLNLVGDYTPSFHALLQQKLAKVGAQQHVTFSGYFANHDDALKQVAKARYALVPVKIDFISGSIRESVQLGLPVITYATKGTPHMNVNGPAVLLSEVGDVQGMAQNMLSLYGNEELAATLNANAKRYLQRICDLDAATQMLTDMYHAVYENFHHGTPIPQHVAEAGY
jgi:glycosyltransferase involved in cell wall biosynthesis